MVCLLGGVTIPSQSDVIIKKKSNTSVWFLTLQVTVAERKKKSWAEQRLSEKKWKRCLCPTASVTTFDLICLPSIST